ncbi:MAG: YkgJ family cysteine cluster protein [Verrucomicrobiales bacterium]|jgi:Fe-S-cluster containining protein|nr:YkgJ family cysteine cluster protein [Verrucomicrobiales bacterium]
MKTTQVFSQNKPGFLCRRCGNCCRWAGVVKLADGEAERIATFLNVSVAQFVAECAELHPRRICLVLKTRADGECWFLSGLNGCQINPVKPAQCDGFPNRWNFPGWRENCAAIEAERGVYVEAI